MCPKKMLIFEIILNNWNTLLANKIVKNLSTFQHLYVAQHHAGNILN